MVVAPLKPSGFKARVPSEPKDLGPVTTNPKTLVVIVGADSSLKLNTETDMGTAGDPSNLIRRRNDVFEQRIANSDVSELFADDLNRPAKDHIERTVFIKAPQSLNYGSVARVVDAVKIAGGYPISLQIDDLD